ncbi:MAG TPA: hypothetical protein PKC42_02235 [Candidatus Nanoperiomorbaceae bacterium]|jgi:hypothetical protein|nr:MAG: hypothetical protein IPL44_00750 [Candidatus Saccharibacteria bacterium]HMQ09185.1 hypothetical protein [Candidatus Nanoperiomorbaceae bacterium]HMQ96898.1 hypothetical protein [Candidatus Nanoperiomorbaceae bacterium]
MIQLNLLPDVKKQLLHAQMQRNLVISICIIITIVAGSVILILGGIMGGQAIQKSNLTQSIADSQDAITKKQSDSQLDEYLTVQNQLSKISSLKNQQLDYSRVFDYLKQLNPAAPNSVSLSSVKLAAPGVSSDASTTESTGVTVEMQGETTNYSSLNVFKSTLSLAKFSYAPKKGANIETKSLFSSVTVTSSALTDDKLSFSIIAVFDVAVFSSDSVDIKLDIPNETTSDSDRNSPSNIFSSESTSSSSTSTEGN